MQLNFKNNEREALVHRGHKVGGGETPLKGHFLGDIRWNGSMLAEEVGKKSVIQQTLLNHIVIISHCWIEGGVKKQEVADKLRTDWNEIPIQATLHHWCVGVCL